MKLTVINIYDDDKLVYNPSTARYELSIAYVRNEFGENFQDDAAMQKRITKNSRRVYNYIYTHGHHANKEVVTFLLDRTKEGRNFLFEALKSQMEADAETGFNDLVLNPSVDVANGQHLDRNAMRENLIAIETEELIDASGSYFGVSIVSQVQYPWIYFQIMRNNVCK